jgi:hypothetical protein
MNFDGARINISVKKDVTEIKIEQITFWQAFKPSGERSIDFQLEDFGLSQN